MVDVLSQKIYNGGIRRPPKRAARKGRIPNDNEEEQRIDKNILGRIFCIPGARNGAPFDMYAALRWLCDCSGQADDCKWL
jgi:hypothetical protein